MEDIHVVAEKDREEIMGVLRAALYDHGDPPLLATRTGISVSCIHNLRSGRTQWPRPNTMFILTRQLGLALTLMRRNT